MFAGRWLTTLRSLFPVQSLVIHLWWREGRDWGKVWILPVTKRRLWPWHPATCPALSDQGSTHPSEVNVKTDRHTSLAKDPGRLSGSPFSFPNPQLSSKRKELPSGSFPIYKVFLPIHKVNLLLFSRGTYYQITHLKRFGNYKELKKYTNTFAAYFIT